MAGSKTAFLEQALLDMMLGDTAYAVPGTLYVALSTAAFDPSATGSVMNEVVGGAYARQALTNNAANFPAGSGSAPYQKSIGVAVNFPTATAAWGTVLSAYLCDAAANGNTLYGADFGAGLVINTGSSIAIPAGAFVFQES